MGFVSTCSNCGRPWGAYNPKEESRCSRCYQPLKDRVEAVQPWSEIERLQERMTAVLTILRPQAVWDWPVPEGQGLPDGETWALYQDAMGAQRLIDILEGTEAASAAKEK